MISRDDILKQADKVISDLGASRAILEIQYENEVCIVHFAASVIFTSILCYLLKFAVVLVYVWSMGYQFD